MKHTFRTILVAAMTMLTVSFVGCTKEDNNNAANNSGGGITETVEWVDLGLPSGLLWASCNVGANSPEKYGVYFAWGETQPKSVYDWSSYAYGSGVDQLTKYCYDAEYGFNGYTDSLTTLEPVDDAATFNLGDGARTPTNDEWGELYYKTTAKRDTINGVSGCRFTGDNGNSIFLPAAGYRLGSELYHAGSLGIYWSASLYPNYPFVAWHYDFISSDYDAHDICRCCGFSVRAVRAR